MKFLQPLIVFLFLTLFNTAVANENGLSEAEIALLEVADWDDSGIKPIIKSVNALDTKQKRTPYLLTNNPQILVSYEAPSGIDIENSYVRVNGIEASFTNAQSVPAKLMTIIGLKTYIYSNVEGKITFTLNATLTQEENLVEVMLVNDNGTSNSQTFTLYADSTEFDDPSEVGQMVPSLPEILTISPENESDINASHPSISIEYKSAVALDLEKSSVEVAGRYFDLKEQTTHNGELLLIHKGIFSIYEEDTGTLTYTLNGDLTSSNNIVHITLVNNDGYYTSADVNYSSVIDVVDENVTDPHDDNASEEDANAVRNIFIRADANYEDELGLALTQDRVFYSKKDKDIIFLGEEMTELDASIDDLVNNTLHADPAKIYHWVLENIAFESYQGSRKDALSVFRTKRGNDIDQSALLITMFRAIGIDAEFAFETKNVYMYENNRNRCFVSAVVPLSAIGYGRSEDKISLILAPWHKGFMHTNNGYNLFTRVVADNGLHDNIPSALTFDFEAYLDNLASGVIEDHNKSTVELYEEKLQRYLFDKYPGKSLADLPLKKEVAKRPSSLLPTSLPFHLGDEFHFSYRRGIPKVEAPKVTIELLADTDDKTLLLHESVYLRDISSKRLVVDFSAKNYINQTSIDKVKNGIFGLTDFQKDEDGNYLTDQYKQYIPATTDLINLQPTLRKNGIKISGEVTSVKYDEKVIYRYKMDNSKQWIERPSFKAGSVMALIFDNLTVSNQWITEIKEELNTFDPELLLDESSLKDATKKSFLEKYAYLLGLTYLQRQYQNETKIKSYLHVTENLTGAYKPTRIIVQPQEFYHASSITYGIYPSMQIDATVNTGIFVDSKNSVVSPDSKFFKLASNLYMYPASMNESDIFEDWQSTESSSTLEAFVAARKENIDILDLTKENITFYEEDGIHYILDLFKFSEEHHTNEVNLNFIEVDDISTPGDMIRRGLQIREEINGTLAMEHITLTPDYEGGAIKVVVAKHKNSYYHKETHEKIYQKLMSGFSIRIPHQPTIQHASYKVIDLNGNLETFKQSRPIVAWIEKDANSVAYVYNGNDGGETLADISNAEEKTENISLLDENGTLVDNDIATLADDAGMLRILKPNQLFHDNYSLKNSLLGDPVNVVTGEYIQEEFPDTAIKTFGGTLSVIRTYRSQFDRKYPGIFGHNWTWNHGERIYHFNCLDDSYKGDKVNTLCYDEKGDLKHTTLKVYETSSGQLMNLNDLPAGATFTVIGDEIHNKDGSIYTFRDYNAPVGRGELLKKEYANGLVLNFSYEKAFIYTTKITINDNFGHFIELNGVGRVTSITDSAGGEVSYNYDDNHNLKTFTNHSNHETNYDYYTDSTVASLKHNLKTYTLPNTDKLELFYYPNDTVSHHTNSRGDSYSFQYSRYNHYVETWNESDAYYKIFYNDNYDVIRVNNEDGTVETNTYDDDHNRLTHTDGNGYTTKYEYDDKRHMIKQTNELDEVTEYIYDINSPKHLKLSQALTPSEHCDRAFTIISPTQFKITNRYDDNCNVVESTDSDNKPSSSTFVRNLDNKITEQTSTDALDRNTTITYYESGNGAGLPHTITNYKGATTLTYDSRGQVKTNEDARGYISTFDYNALGQLLSVTADESVTTFTYTPDRALETKTLPNGATTTYHYDAKTFDIEKGPLLSEETDTYGNSVRYIYNERGLKSTIVDKMGNMTHYVYDAKDRLSQEIDAQQNITYYTYDGNSNLVKQELVTNQNKSYVLRTKYDKANRKIESIDAKGYKTFYTYTKDGKIHKIRKNIKDSDGDSENMLTINTYYPNGLLHTKTTGEELAQFNLVDNRQIRSSHFEYDAQGRITKEFNSLNQRISFYEYTDKKNADGHTAIKRTYLDDSFETSYYDANDNLVKVIDPMGYSFMNEYDRFNRKIKTYNGQDSTYNEYEYDIMGNLLKTTAYIEKHNPYGPTTLEAVVIGINEYDLRNRKTAVTKDNQNYQYFIYDENDNNTDIIDEEGYSSGMEYNALNQMILVRNALDYVITYTYDGRGLLIQEVKPNGLIIDYSYDANGNPVTTKKEHLTTTVTYNEIGQKLIVSDKSGSKYKSDYNIHGQSIRTIDPLGNTVYAKYNSLGQLETAQDAHGIITKFEYNSRGMVEKQTHGFGLEKAQITEFIYDKNLNKTDIIIHGDDEHADIISTMTYDHNNRLLTQTQGNRTTSFTYDSLGRKLTQSDPQGNTQTFTYNNKSQVISVKDAYESTTTFAYTKKGLLASTISAEGITTSSTYDPLGRKVTHTVGEDTRYFAYDMSNEVIYSSDYRGVLTSIERDKFGSIIHSTTGDIRTDYLYDLNHHKPEYIYKAGKLITKHNYNAIGQIDSSETKFDPSSKQAKIVIKYNRTANRVDDIITINSGTGETLRTKSLHYDALGKLEEVLIDDIVEKSFTYDIFGRIKDATSTSTPIPYTNSYTYNEYGNVLTQEANGKVVRTNYDKRNNQTELIYPSGLNIRKTYDANNRLSTIEKRGLTDITFHYDLDNRLKQTSYQNGVTQSLGYDTRGRQTSRHVYHDVDLLLHLENSYDKDSNLISQTYLNSNAIEAKSDQHYYMYDAHSRLGQEEEETSTDLNSIIKTNTYEYDQQDNIIQTIIDEEETNFTPDEVAQDQLTHESSALGSKDIVYDDFGNLIHYGDTHYIFDNFNRLSKVEINNNTIVSYTFDALDRRVSKSANGTTTHYLYNGSNVIEEYQEDEFSKRFVYGDFADHLLFMQAQEAELNTYYFIQDRQQSVRALLNEDGSLKEHYNYTSYGDVDKSYLLKNNTTITSIEGSISPYGYTGRRLDKETNIYYYRARMYNPSLRRFLSEDPAGYADSYNLHSYVKNNPLKYTDPSGMLSLRAPKSWSTGNINLSPPKEWSTGNFSTGNVVRWGNNLGNKLKADIKIPKFTRRGSGMFDNDGAIEVENFVKRNLQSWQKYGDDYDDNSELINTVIITAIVVASGPASPTLGQAMMMSATSAAVSHRVNTGTWEGADRAAIWAAVTAAAAYGVSEGVGAMFSDSSSSSLIGPPTVANANAAMGPTVARATLANSIASSAGHAANFFSSGFGIAFTKAVLHGVTQASIAHVRSNGNSDTRSAFWGGFVASGFSVGNEGYGGIVGRTAIMSGIGGLTAQALGGDFNEGAKTAMIVHLFNTEASGKLVSLFRGEYRNDGAVIRNQMQDGDIVFGKRALGYIIGGEHMSNSLTHISPTLAMISSELEWIIGSISDILNLEIAHEQVFYKVGNKIYNIGFDAANGGEWLTSENIDDYVVSNIYHVNRTLNKNMFIEGFNNQYSLPSNNCQDFSDYCAAVVRQIQWQSK
jgi:RHS repeat-associated protein